MELDWTRIDENDLSGASNDVWEATYKEVETLCDFIFDFLELDLERFKRQSGKARLAISAVRKKEKESFVTKALGFSGLEKQNSKRRKEKFKEINNIQGLTRTSVFDLINDLIGVRQVFYFERDIQEAALYWMSYPVYIPVQVIDWTQDISGYDQDIVKWWVDKKNKQRPKASGYESLHFIVRFDADIFQARLNISCNEKPSSKEDEEKIARWKKLSQCLNENLKKNKDFIAQLGAVRFEVQCRTILEHTWAEVEHRSNYSKVKVGHNDTERIATRKKFRSYKAILRAAQIFQNSLRAGFSRWEEDDGIIMSRSTSVVLKPRDHFWIKLNDAWEKVKYINTLFPHALDETGPIKSRTLWRNIFDEIHKLIVANYGRNFKLTIGGESPEEYGKKRLLTMYLGFILGYSYWVDLKKGKRIRSATHKIFINEVAKFYLQNQYGNEIKIPSPAVVAVPVRIYETVRILDEYFACTCFEHGEFDNIFSDPLIGARTASVYYRHFGSFRRSTELYREAKDKVDVWSKLYPSSPKALLLTNAYLGKRIAENLWTAYNLDGYRDEDLFHESKKNGALDEAKKAYKSLYTDIQVVDFVDDNKAVAKINAMHKTLPGLILTMELMVARKKVLKKQTNDRKEDIDLNWSAIKFLLNSISDLRQNFEHKAFLDFDKQQTKKNIFKGSLRQQGFAIWLACLALDAKGNEKEGILKNARQHIHAARLNTFSKLKQSYGGVMPFHLDVAMDIEGFISSLH